MNMSLVLRLPRKMHLARSSSNVPWLPSFVEMLQKPHVLLTFEVHNPLRLPRETTSEPPKVARTCRVLCILTSKCASRHNGVHFFNISTSKSGPRMVCFLHFDLEMCFPPQRHALFIISTSKSCPNLVCSAHFDLDMCFAPHRRALFNITTSKSGPTLLCFVHFDFEMCFAPQRRAIFHLSSGQLAPHPPL